MAPNPRVMKAFRAMRAIGIPEEKVKPVLKDLLKLYDRNWELIEEENYRALADAILERDEMEVIPAFILSCSLIFVYEFKIFIVLTSIFQVATQKNKNLVNSKVSNFPFFMFVLVSVKFQCIGVNNTFPFTLF